MYRGAMTTDPAGLMGYQLNVKLFPFSQKIQQTNTYSVKKTYLPFNKCWFCINCRQVCTRVCGL